MGCGCRRPSVQCSLKARDEGVVLVEVAVSNDGADIHLEPGRGCGWFRQRLWSSVSPSRASVGRRDQREHTRQKPGYRSVELQVRVRVKSWRDGDELDGVVHGAGSSGDWDQWT